MVPISPPELPFNVGKFVLLVSERRAQKKRSKTTSVKPSSVEALSLYSGVFNTWSACPESSPNSDQIYHNSDQNYHNSDQKSHNSDQNSHNSDQNYEKSDRKHVLFCFADLWYIRKYSFTVLPGRRKTGEKNPILSKIP